MTYNCIQVLLFQFSFLSLAVFLKEHFIGILPAILSKFNEILCS